MLCSFQIDPSVLQQSLQPSGLLAQPLAAEPGAAPHGSSLQAAGSPVPASVVIQPISGLTISPMPEQDSVLTSSGGGKSPSGLDMEAGLRLLSRVWVWGTAALFLPHKVAGRCPADDMVPR